MFRNVRVVPSSRTAPVALFALSLAAAVIAAFLSPHIAHAGFEVDTGGTLTTNLVEYWSGSSLTGSYASNVLTNNNSVTVGASGGKIDKAFDFGTSNTTAYLSIASSLGVAGNTPYSFCGWYKSSGTVQSDARFWTMNTAASNDTFNTIFVNPSDGSNKTKFRRWGGGNDAVFDDFNTRDGAYHFLCIRWDGSTVTGNIDARTAVTFSQSGTTGWGEPATFTIGANYNGSQATAGLLSEVGFWSKALSNQEVTDLYNGGSGNAFSTSTDPNPARSAYFDGDDAWSWSASNVAFNSTDPFTVEFWYRNASSSTVPTSTAYFLDTRTNNRNGFAIFRNPSGINFSLNCANTSSTVQLSSAESEANRSAGAPYWHHVAVTKAATTSSTSAFKLYYDGTQRVSDKCFTSTSTDRIWIPGNPSSTNLFNGYIDEVRIWSTERSSLDIATSTYEVIVATSTGLVGYWRFNSTSTDLVTGNAHSEQGGNPTFSTSTPFGHFLTGEGIWSVNTTSSEIRWTASTTYMTEWSAAVATWSALSAIDIYSATSSLDIDVFDYFDSLADWVGAWAYEATTTDAILLNSYYLSSSTPSEVQNVTTHELGHALGLDHSIFGNVMYYIQTPRIILGPQDLSDYEFQWGN